jgi:ankyrin repeat protein
VHRYVLIFALTTDLHKVAEDYKNIAGDGLAVSQKSLHIQQKEHDQKLSDQQAKCLQLFRLTKSTGDATYEWYKDRIAGRVEGTCMWFLNHPHFQEWRRKESGPLLVSADPGCGKSVLAKYLIDHVLPESSTVCYFFFKDRVQNTVREALCALLHQLFSQRRGLLVHAIKQYDKDGAGLVNSTSLLWSVFEDAVQDANAGSVTIILDALDECAESETKDLMRHMETQVRNGESCNAKLKLFMTSRPYEHVVSELHSLLKAFPRIRIPGEDASETISQEVNCVIRYRVDEFAEERRLSDEMRACLENQLLQMEHRTYLWVYLVFDYLKDFRFKRTPKGLASTFCTLPTSVDQAYEQILSKSTDRSMVRKALAIILAATRPLTLSEMNVAMEVDENTKSIDDLDLEPEHEFASRLRSWCGLFVSVYNGRIYFLHQTAREFLLAERLSSNAIQQELVWHGSTTMKDAHTALAECCVRFLSFFDDNDSLTTDQVQGVKNDAFLEYSAKFWGLHLRESRICDDERAAIAPLTVKLSDPDAKVYLMWATIYSRRKLLGIENFSTILMVACYFGHIAVVGRSLNEGANVNGHVEEYGNALQAASYKGYEQIVKLLLDHGADVNAQGGEYGNALQAALSEGHEQIVKLLLDKGADINAQGGYYGNALQAASYGGYEQTVKLLIDDGAAVNAQGGEYRNALQAASWGGHEQTVKLLLDHGADVNAQGGYYGNALQVALCRGHEQIVKLLLDKGADINAQGGYYGNALQAASYEGYEQIVKLLLDHGADVNAQGGEYGNALQAALSEGHEQIMKLLLDHGADVNAQGGEYGNALQAASWGGHEQIVKLLLEKGADLTIPDDDGSTPLNAAASDGHLEVVKLLLEKGADLTVSNHDGSTPLHRAAANGHIEVVKLLLDKGANINAQGGVYGNALEVASFKGHLDLLKFLISRLNTTLQCEDRYGRTLLWWAAAGGNAAIVETLIRQYNFDPRVSDRLGRTPFWIATKKGHDAVSKLLWEECGEAGTERPVPSERDHDPQGMICDVCTSSIAVTAFQYRCYLCADGEWDLCEDCEASGASCADATHTLVKRIKIDEEWVQILS